MNIIITKIYYLIIISIVLSCAASPRYKANNNKYKSSKSKKVGKGKTNKSTFNKNIMTYRGLSSYYGHKFHGKLTANGEVFDMYGLTAAHKEMPFNTIVRVTNKNNGTSLIIRINDRGPYIDGRILDCSFGAAKKLGFVKEGIAPVKIEVIEWGDGKYMHHE